MTYSPLKIPTEVVAAAVAVVVVVVVLVMTAFVKRKINGPQMC